MKFSFKEKDDLKDPRQMISFLHYIISSGIENLLLILNSPYNLSGCKSHIVFEIKGSICWCLQTVIHRSLVEIAWLPSTICQIWKNIIILTIIQEPWKEVFRRHLANFHFQLFPSQTQSLLNGFRHLSMTKNLYLSCYLTSSSNGEECLKV